MDYEQHRGQQSFDHRIAPNGHASLNGHVPPEGQGASNGHAPSNGHGTANEIAERNGRCDENGHDAQPELAGGGPARRRSAELKQQRLHQLREARQRQGLSVRCVAQRLNMSVGDVRAQEDECADILLSDLYRWQSVLEIPLEELLSEPQDALSPRVLVRARMLRIMKTARAIRAQARSDSGHRLAKLLISQLIELMPELKEVAAWPTVGHRRSADEFGRIAEHPVPDDFMHEAS